MSFIYFHYDVNKKIWIVKGINYHLYLFCLFAVKQLYAVIGIEVLVCWVPFILRETQILCLYVVQFWKKQLAD